MNFYVLANWMQGQGLSGGDRIFIELCRRWQMHVKIKLFVSKDGWAICQRSGIGNLDHQIWANDIFNRWGYAVNYFYRTVISIFKASFVRLSKDDIVYSTSDFYPDALGALWIKLKNKGVRWIAGFYLFAPKPWEKNSPYARRSSLVGLFYWLTQWPAYWLVKRFADVVFVTSEPDVPKFVTPQRTQNEVVVIKGGVDTTKAVEWMKSGMSIPPEKRQFDACFIGRFHVQKGVLQLVDIWKMVCSLRPGSKLAMIGDGPLFKTVRERIETAGLKSNIVLVGFADGERKYEIFKQCKMVLHPATFDSGGMAAAEAMAWGLPGVSFDLEALKTYYPRGIAKVPLNDCQAFSKMVLKLLEDRAFYAVMSRQATDLVFSEWDWELKSVDIWKKIII